MILLPTAKPSFTAYSITFSFTLGSVPGCPSDITDVFVFGDAPYIFSSGE